MVNSIEKYNQFYVVQYSLFLSVKWYKNQNVFFAESIVRFYLQKHAKNFFKIVKIRQNVSKELFLLQKNPKNAIKKVKTWYKNSTKNPQNGVNDTKSW